MVSPKQCTKANVEVNGNVESSQFMNPGDQEGRLRILRLKKVKAGDEVVVWNQKSCAGKHTHTHTQMRSKGRENR